MGKPQTEETKIKISRSLTGVPKPPFTPDHCQKIRDAKLGSTASPATRDQMRQSQQARRRTEHSIPFSATVQADGRIDICRKHYTVGKHYVGKIITVDPSHPGYYRFFDGSTLIREVPLNGAARTELSRQTHLKDPTVRQPIHFDQKENCRFCGTTQYWGKAWINRDAEGWQEGDQFHVIYDQKSYFNSFYQNKR